MRPPGGWRLEARLYSPSPNKTRIGQTQVNRHQKNGQVLNNGLSGSFFEKSNFRIAYHLFPNPDTSLKAPVILGFPPGGNCVKAADHPIVIACTTFSAPVV